MLRKMRNTPDYDELPFFVCTGQLQRFMRRSERTMRSWLVKGKLPEREILRPTHKGWRKEIIVEWLEEHPEAIRHG